MPRHMCKAANCQQSYETTLRKYCLHRHYLVYKQTGTAPHVLRHCKYMGRIDQLVSADTANRPGSDTQLRTTGNPNFTPQII